MDMHHEDLVEMKLCELLADRSSSVSELAIGVRKEIAQASGEASELLYKTYAVSNVFTNTHRMKEAFIHIATYAAHVNLGFNFGVRLPDEDNLLQGTGKLIRHIRIHSLSDLRRNPVKKLVRSAIVLGRELAEDAGGVQTKKLFDKTG